MEFQGPSGQPDPTRRGKIVVNNCRAECFVFLLNSRIFFTYLILTNFPHWLDIYISIVTVCLHTRCVFAIQHAHYVVLLCY